jgi:myo-inositol 2-dehydrogenase / D-chiro-inositol 1-dehydrogenase
VSVRRAPPSSVAPDGLSDPQLVTIETSSGVIVNVEIFVSCTFGYQVRCEVVCEKGTATIGGDAGLCRHTAGSWGGDIAPDFHSRFGHAFDMELQRWANAARRGEIDGPSAWDGYAAAAVTEAGVRAQESHVRTEVELIECPSFYAENRRHTMSRSTPSVP